jgi:(2Fe-2S) ferredoxin/ubiquinone/menaquinone biosynthesis C-methylase UbiE
MEPFRLHVYVCDQKKPDGSPCCSARGSEALLAALRKSIGAHGLIDVVQVTTSGSLGLCARGPNMVVYPEGTWYSGVSAADVEAIVTEHFVGGKPVERLLAGEQTALFDEIRDNRGKAVAAMAARAKSAELPDEISQPMRAFQDSRILLTAIELDVFSAVETSPYVPAIAAHLGVDARALAMLLHALVALNLLEKKDDSFFNVPAAKRFLIDGAPHDSRGAMKHTNHLWDRWSHLTAAVRAGTAPAFEDQSDRGADWTTAFIAAMHRNASARAQAMLAHIGLDGVARMLDVGGGSGALSIAFAKAKSDLAVDLFDLPNVVPLTKKYVAEAGVADQVHFVEGDFRADSLGENTYDLVLLSQICHMNGEAENALLFQKVYSALKSGGRLVIADFVLEDSKTAPKSAAVFALNMLVGTQSGTCYSVSEYRKALTMLGFSGVHHVVINPAVGLILAIK